MAKRIRVSEKHRNGLGGSDEKTRQNFKSEIDQRHTPRSNNRNHARETATMMNDNEERSREASLRDLRSFDWGRMKSQGRLGGPGLHRPSPAAARRRSVSCADAVPRAVSTTTKQADGPLISESKKSSSTKGEGTVSPTSEAKKICSLSADKMFQVLQILRITHPNAVEMAVRLVQTGEANTTASTIGSPLATATTLNVGLTPSATLWKEEPQETTLTQHRHLPASGVLSAELVQSISPLKWPTNADSLEKEFTAKGTAAHRSAEASPEEPEIVVLPTVSLEERVGHRRSKRHLHEPRKSISYLDQYNAFKPLARKRFKRAVLAVIAAHRLPSAFLFVAEHGHPWPSSVRTKGGHHKPIHQALWDYHKAWQESASRTSLPSTKESSHAAAHGNAPAVAHPSPQQHKSHKLS